MIRSTNIIEKGCEMKANNLLMILLLMGALSGLSGYAESELPYADNLQAVLDSTCQLTGVRGVSVAIIIPGYKPWAGVSGESYPGQPVNPDMLFDMASASKTITAALILDLCEDGLISLDDPISMYLPDYPNVNGSITIRQLLNHTCGLYDMVSHPNGPFNKPYHEIKFEKCWTMQEIFTELGGEPYFTPGEGFHYTQAGYQLASLIVQSVTHSSLADQIQKRLLDPLGIDGMMLDFTRPVPQGYEVAHPWVDVDSDGVPEDVDSWSRNWIASLSRILIYTRAMDFAVWAHELFNGNILEQSSLEDMLTFVHPKPEEMDKPLFSDYGLGVGLVNPQLVKGCRTWGHFGSIYGYRSFLGHLADYNVTLVILYNSDTDNAFPILDGLLEIVLENTEGDVDLSEK